MNALLGVRRSLLLIAPEPARCAALLRSPEPAFKGASLLQAMLLGGLPAIERVRAHLVSVTRGTRPAQRRARSSDSVGSWNSGSTMRSSAQRTTLPERRS